MNRVAIPRSGIETTALGFGCAKLLRVGSARERERLLGEAWEAGIRHFDVARSYGLGAAERELGRFLRGRRNDAVIATKFGIDVASRGRRVAALQAPFRMALRFAPVLRRLVAGRTGSLVSPRRYDAATARASLETSLRELQTDRVDLFLLHEPTAEDLRSGDPLEFLEEARHAGLIGNWGLSGEFHEVATLRGSYPELAPVVQFPDDVLSRNLERLGDPHGAFVVTFSPISTALDRIVGRARRDERLRRRWLEESGIDATDATAVAGVLLAYAVASNPAGVVLFSTTRRARVRELGNAASSERVREQGRRFAAAVARDLV